ncbi:tripeptidyl-peptidase 2 isoform X2 [Bradysia coprophila]|uniref:tripeptidyl-peptidase 2 isoform X2 n=1 Tax=Bradysia coprophila TaxID=38358 RepID=UPI00187DB66B|nr:tripeptidyl-peptidase 2 isoform X2 [Bradysia coprophila]
MDVVVDKKFPSENLVPKNETGVLNFLKKYPTYNGEGVTIAIFDSGVDPKSTGLQTTPDGKPKVIERFDCSGSGDVDISKKITASTDGTILGLSGRTLKISKRMKAENVAGDDYRIGIKSVYDLYPSKIKEKVLNDMKLNEWDEPHKKAIVDVARNIEEFNASNSINSSNTLSQADKLKKEDLEAAQEYLVTFDKKFECVRTSFDCIVYASKDGWVAVIDVNENGDLDNALYLREYTKYHDVQSINNYLSITMNVFDDGNVLELVGMCSGHGTHVSAIASANHGNDLDGVAPGAKIVSCTIGDNRLGSMETGAAIIRAMIKVMELCRDGRRVHVINMSYGEHAAWSNSGRVGELMTEVVNKYGVVWVAAAGNHGPALSTIGTPPDIVQPCLVGVGAYVSPEMMEAEYTLRQKLPPNVYTWTSRDPCVDGGQGVTVCAPGAAIASVPEYTLAKQQLMNGTSMASPHVAGAVALLLSGLIHRNLSYSPYSVKRALWDSATYLSHVDPFAQGNGLLNVEKSFEHLVQFAEAPDRDVRFAVSVGTNHAKGIHLRHAETVSKDNLVVVEPVFLNDKEIDPKLKINFNLRLTMVSTKPWVQTPQFLDLCYSSRSFSVKVDPTALPIGVHSAAVKAYDITNIAKGVLFEVPVTVVVPHVIDVKKTRSIKFNTTTFNANTIVRKFVNVPLGATWAALEMQTTETTTSNQPAKFFVHTLQLLPMKFCKHMETQKLYSVSTENPTVHLFKCEGDNVLEVCIAKYWSNAGETDLNFKIEFHGIKSNGLHTMHSANGIHRIDLTTLTTEDVQPSIQLKSAVMVLKPTESKILPLTTRDVIPPERQIYQNLLTYNFHLTKMQELALHTPLLNDVLYESEFESQFWMVFDANKMLTACGDAYSMGTYHKLEKGDYVVRLQIRHEKKELLEKVSEAVMVAAFKLPASITLDTYTNYKSAVTAGKKCGTLQISHGARPIYVAPLANEKLTKGGIPNQCSWLEGTITFAKDESARKADSYVFKYILTEGPPIKKANGTPKENKNKLDEFKEGLRDYQLGMIPKLDLPKAEEVYKSVIDMFPNYLPAHVSFCQKLDPAEIKNQLPFTYKKSFALTVDELDATKDTLKRIIELCDMVIGETDSNALLAYYGLKTDTRPDAAKIKTNMDKQKFTLLEAYVKKSVALSKLQLIETFQSADESTNHSLDELNNIYTEVGKFIDYYDAKVQLITLWHGFMNQQYGRMLKVLQKMYEDKIQKDVLEELQNVVTEKKWGHINRALQKIVLMTNPPGYRLF